MVWWCGGVVVWWWWCGGVVMQLSGMRCLFIRCVSKQVILINSHNL